MANILFITASQVSITVSYKTKGFAKGQDRKRLVIVHTLMICCCKNSSVTFFVSDPPDLV